MRLFFVVALTVIFGLLSYFLVFYGLGDVFRQHSAESYSHVQGTVVSGTITSTRGSKGRVYYHPDITYRYTVNGLGYTGFRYRYDDHPNDYGSVYAIVNGHPAGSTVDVYYNPLDAPDSLLSPGVDGRDMFLAFFMSAVVLLLWLIPVKAAQQPELPWTGPESTGGVPVITEMLLTRLRMPRYPPLGVALVATAFLLFLAGVVVGTGLLPTPPWGTGECALVLALIGGVAVYAWQYNDVQSGKRDLIIDAGAQTVQLPLTWGRREQTPISISQIVSILFIKARHRTGKGGVYYTYSVVFEMANGEQEKLVNLSQTRADSLATWLKEKLGLPERYVEPAEDERL